MVVEALAVTKGIDILCDIITDLVKDILLQKFRKQNEDINFSQMLRKECNSKYNTKFYVIFESTVFTDFINQPQPYDFLCRLIEFDLLNQTNTLIKRKVHYKIANTDLNEIYDYLIENIQNEYRIHTVVQIPKKELLKECLEFICNIVTKYVIGSLDPKERFKLFSINSRFASIEEQFIKSSEQFVYILKNMKQFPIKHVKVDNEIIKNKYHSILKHRNSTAHIYLLDTFDFNLFYVPPCLEIQTSNNVLFVNTNMQVINVNRMRKRQMDYISNGLYDDWRYIFDYQNIIYVTGGAGYGKSLFMKKIINDYESLNILHPSEYLIIYGEIKMFYVNGKDVPLSMLEFLQLSMKNSTLMNESEISTEFIQSYLDKGRCLLLLDALDEVEKSKREEIHGNIISFLNEQNPNNKICITSRTRGFIPDKKIQNYNIMSLNEIQIQTYVDNIIKLGKFDEADKISFMNQAKMLVNKGFLNSFLVLSLLINIYKAERELPENKLELYQKCFEYIANRREKEKTSGKYKWEDIGLLMKDNTFIELANLCYPNNTDIEKNKIKNKLIKIYTPKFGNEANAENAIEEFLNFCSDRTELFVPSAEDHFKFFHRSFFEYFYSQYIFTRCQTVDEIYDKLIHFDVDSEVFELTVALLKQKSEIKYQELIEKMFSLIDEELSEEIVSSFNILTLCMQVIDDKLYRDKFFYIFLKYKKLLITNSWNLNNGLIYEFLLNNKDYYGQINREFYYDNMLYLITSLKNAYRTFKELKKEGMHNVNLAHYVTRYNRDLHIKIFLETNDIGKILKNLNENEINQIRTKTKAENKQWYGVKKAIAEYKKLKNKEQRKIEEIIAIGCK